MFLNPDAIAALTGDLRAALDNDDPSGAAKAAGQLSSARVARVLAEFPSARVARIVQALEPAKAGRVIGHLPLILSAEMIGELDPALAARLFRNVPADNAADIYGVLPEPAREALGKHLDERWLEEIRNLTAYPADSAGSAMTPRFVTIEEHRTVGEALDALMAASERTERPVYIYVIDRAGVLSGIISLRDLLNYPRATAVADVMNRNVVAVEVDDPAVDAAQLLQDRRLMMIPVLTRDRRVAGVLTFDDAIDILSENVAEQFAAVGGTREESFLTRPNEAVRHRLPWMAINVFLNLGAVTVITGFEATIAQVAILAAFIPMITDMGGNVGIQALSVAIRSIALGEARPRDLFRAARKELLIGLCNGLALGGLFAAIAFFWRGNLWLAGLAGLALGSNVLVAGVVGGCLPFVIKKLGKDPAMMTGPFLTTITDITGVTIYLGLSTLFIARLLG